MLFAKRRNLESIKTEIEFLWKRIEGLERSQRIPESNYPYLKELEHIWTKCDGCKVMDAAMRVMSALQFRYSNGAEALGINVNFRSALRYDSSAQEIVINEEELMQAIIFANPGQKKRKLRLVSEAEFEEYKK